MTDIEPGRVIGRVCPREPVILRLAVETSSGGISEVLMQADVIRQRGGGADLECLIETNTGDVAWVEAGCVEHVNAQYWSAVGEVRTFSPESVQVSWNPREQRVTLFVHVPDELRQALKGAAGEPCDLERAATKLRYLVWHEIAQVLAGEECRLSQV